MQAQAEIDPADAPGRLLPRQLPWRRLIGTGGLVLAVLLFALSLAAFLADQAIHPHAILTWYDLNVYNDAGLITRQLPSILYTWELKVGVQFTYTPFAALVFAGGTFVPMATLRWLMTIASMGAIPLTAWLTLGGLGRRGAGRLAAALAVSALALWTQPVVKAMFLGQIEPLLMLLVVWDLTRSDARQWKGIGIGIAAGIKLVPLIFIPYLLLAGKFRQAAVAAGTFAATIVIGFVALPGPSASYWLTGYFVRPGRTGSVHSLVNQSLLGVLARLYGSVAPAQGPWLPLALTVAAVGLVGGAMLSRTGRPVQGWTLVGITSVLVSPISWDHHWVWIVPALALLAGLAMTARPVARAGCALALVLIAGIMGSWPWRYSGPRAYVPRRGLLGWFVKPPEVTQIKVLHGWQLLTWNLWVAIGSVVYLALLGAAVLAWRRRPRKPRKQKVTVQAAPSPIDALLARADAILRAGSPLAGIGAGRTGQMSENGSIATSAAGDGKPGASPIAADEVPSDAYSTNGASADGPTSDANGVAATKSGGNGAAGTAAEQQGPDDAATRPTSGSPRPAR